jgi:predicted transposase YbfD/YdcC
MAAIFLEHFSVLKDPRIERKKLHAMQDILVLVVCAVISGAEGWEEIAAFGHSKLEWLRHFVPLKNGVPSHDCIAYVMTRLNSKHFSECFISWVEEVREKVPNEIIAIDGKTARGSQNRKHGKNPLHMVSAWATANRLVLGQEATEEKSNEITAIPKLLNLLELHGCIVTIDAMGCQREIAAQIVDQGADYVLGLKGNQSSLHEEVEDYFTTARVAEFKNVKYDYHEEIDKGHGRLETRRYWITEDLCTLSQAELWKGLKSIGMVERTFEEGAKCCIEKRYFICSIPAEAKLYAQAVREHWGIENSLHCRLDVTLKEDASRIRKGEGAAIMTTIIHLCLNLFQKESSKLSLKRKQKKAAWDDNFRANVLFA